MYEFPPPIWTNQDWTVGRLGLIAVLGLIVPLIVAKLTKPSSIMTTVWVVVGVTSLCILGGYFTHGRGTYEPYRYMMALPALLTIVSAGFVVITWWNKSGGIGRIHEGIAVLLIMFVLITLTLPGVSTPPEVPNRTQCKNNLKQIGFVLHNYHDQWQRFPPASLGPVDVSWRINLLPFIEQEKLAQKYDRSQRWDGPANAPLQTIRVSEYACPTRPNSLNSNGQFLTSYVAPTLPGAIFARKEGSAIADIKDGTSNTLLTMEACGTSIVWSLPVDTEPPARRSMNGSRRRRG